MKLNLTFITSACLLTAVLLLSNCKHEPIILSGPGPDPVDTSTVDTTGTGVGCDPDTVYFANDILPLINSSCAIPGCHDPASAEDDVVLNNYANIISSGEITPGDPGDSKLYEEITETDPDKIMPPPSSGITLTTEQIASIFTWIQQGALNNACNDSINCDTANMSFANDVKPIIDLNCTGCHSGSTPSGGISTVTYSDVSAISTIGLLIAVIDWEAGAKPMPQGQNKLSACDRDKIRSWVNAGSPNN